MSHKVLEMLVQSEEGLIFLQLQEIQTRGKCGGRGCAELHNTNEHLWSVQCMGNAILQILYGFTHLRPV